MKSERNAAMKRSPLKLTLLISCGLVALTHVLTLSLGLISSIDLRWKIAEITGTLGTINGLVFFTALLLYLNRQKEE
ncbi:hypothetical protein AYO49_03315 [Verrucomicrobiaceae bacterium SCGC AG-212-N21]|nr:hypothetical protein AYO49_03315 [Verrucomicrobiaceae bacterium SCGC AG-212-N21]